MMARSASADIMCVGPKSVREKFTGIIRYAMHLVPPFISPKYLLYFPKQLELFMVRYFLNLFRNRSSYDAMFFGIFAIACKPVTFLCFNFTLLSLL